jgi:hypothetical protein
MSSLENSQTNTLILESVASINSHIGYGELKLFLLQCYQNAQLSEQFGTTAEERHSNFYIFRCFYNHLLKLEMYHEPTLTGVNLI